MIFPRSRCLVGLVWLLGACGGDRRADDAATRSPAGEAPRPDSSSTARSPASAEPHVAAFATDTSSVADSTAAGDSNVAIRSVYTSLAEAECRLVERDEETGGISSRCPGTAGHVLLVHDYDARMTVDVVTPDGRTHRLRYSAVISSAFSSLGPRAEWRVRNGTPIALIVRVNAFENPETPDRATSYLAVAKITSREVCAPTAFPPRRTPTRRRGRPRTSRHRDRASGTRAEQARPRPLAAPANERAHL